MFFYGRRKTSLMKWDGSDWARACGDPLVQVLTGLVSPQTARRVSELAVELSARRVGASIVITPTPEEVQPGGSTGVMSHFRDPAPQSVESMSTFAFLRLASIDGCVSLDTDGMIRNAGVILDIPADFALDTEGARLAATRYASQWGIAIKISSDGPITVCSDGEIVMRLR